LPAADSRRGGATSGARAQRARRIIGHTAGDDAPTLIIRITSNPNRW